MNDITKSVTSLVADGAHIRVLLSERLQLFVNLLVHPLYTLIHFDVPPALGVWVAAILLLRGELLAVT